MTDPPRLTINNLRRTTNLIRQTTHSFSSNLFTFLFLSLLLFSFQFLVEKGAHLLTTFIDRDPSLKSLLSRLNLAGHHLHHHRNPKNAALPRLHRRRSFLHLSRVGTLDDDFFSDDEDSDRTPFGPSRKIPPNGSSLILNTFHPRVGFFDFAVDNGIMVSDIVRPEVQFKAEEAAL
ncbi:hypothetical protein LINPERPRIM_LOCUS739 [Linum perenne]